MAQARKLLTRAKSELDALLVGNRGGDGDFGVGKAESAILNKGDRRILILGLNG